MAWIESHQTLREHPKLRKAVRILGVAPQQVVGHLHFLWWWALDHAEDGDLGDFDAQDIADCAGWDGDPDEFVRALVECGPGDRAGFLEYDGDRLVLHDWFDYAGKLLETRRHAAGQKRKHRELYNDRALCAAIRERDGDECRYCGKPTNWRDRRGPDGGTYDYVDPFGVTCLDNLVVACRACNAGKNQRTPDQAGYLLRPVTNKSPQIPMDGGQVPTPTVPNPTEPDRTQNTLAPAPAADVPDPFDEWWSAYPKKVGKKAARRAYLRALKDTGADVLLTAMTARADLWRRDGTARQFIPDPATWLNQGRWDDELDQPAPVTELRPDAMLVRNQRRQSGEACPECADAGLILDGDGLAWPCLTCQREDAG